MRPYKFNRPDGTHSQGYATVTISGGLADIDLQNADQVRLAEKLGGQPYKPPPKKTSQKKELK